MRKHAVRWLCLGVFIGLSVCGPAFSDCKSDSQQAISMLNAFKQSALNNQHQDTDRFQTEFKPLVDRMQQGQCQSELMGLMSFIQGEQQKYPDPRQNPGFYK